MQINHLLTLDKFIQHKSYDISKIPMCKIWGKPPTLIVMKLLFT
jgi:hypothetical protein